MNQGHISPGAITGGVHVCVHHRVIVY